jgi:hypothetical protein
MTVYYSCYNNTHTVTFHDNVQWYIRKLVFSSTLRSNNLLEIFSSLLIENPQRKTVAITLATPLLSTGQMLKYSELSGSGADGDSGLREG